MQSLDVNALQADYFYSLHMHIEYYIVYEYSKQINYTFQLLSVIPR